MSGNTLDQKDLGSDDTEFITVQLGEETFDVPTSYESMSLPTYLEVMRQLSDVSDGQYGNVECLIRILTAITSIERSYIERISLDQLQPLIKHLSYVFNTPEIDKDINIDSKLNIGEYTFQLEDYAKTKVGTALFIENLYQNAEDKVGIVLDILAAIVRPTDEEGNIEEFNVDKLEERKQYFKEHMSVQQFHSLSFFLRSHAKNYMAGMS